MVLSQFVQRRYALELLDDGRGERGGVGYLLKERIADVDDFCAALHHVGSGGTALDPEVVTIMMTRALEGILEGLTPRQLEVLTLIAEGRSNASIAARLHVSEKAVVQHSSRTTTSACRGRQARNDGIVCVPMVSRTVSDPA